jgi:predicted dehydrogenase
MVRLFAHSGGGREAPKPNSAPPKSMDWNQWCGPAPVRPFNGKLHPGGWRNFLDYANGTMGDWGVHWLDQVLWWTEEKYPKRIFCTGGRDISGPAILNEQEQTTDAPDHQVATFEFEKFTCIWEHRKFAGNATEKHSIGAYFYGTNGILHIGWRDGWTFYPKDDRQAQVHENAQLQEPDGHNLTLLWADFIDAIEKRRPSVARIDVAHRASVLPLLGMVSWRTGRSIGWDGDKEQIINDPKANELLQRPYRAPWKYPTV